MNASTAVAIGHIVVNVPVLLIIFGIGFVLSKFAGLNLLLGIVIGAAVAWLYWSFSVPRWREWALSRGANPEQLERIGVSTGLTWPKGSFLERTEFRRKR